VTSVTFLKGKGRAVITVSSYVCCSAPTNPAYRLTRDFYLVFSIAYGLGRFDCDAGVTLTLRPSG
jgi:hypothetical protein